MKQFFMYHFNFISFKLSTNSDS